MRQWKITYIRTCLLRSWSALASSQEGKSLYCRSIGSWNATPGGGLNLPIRVSYMFLASSSTYSFSPEFPSSTCILSSWQLIVMLSASLPMSREHFPLSDNVLLIDVLAEMQSVCAASRGLHWEDTHSADKAARSNMVWNCFAVKCWPAFETEGCSIEGCRPRVMSSCD